MKFSDLKLSEPILHAVSEAGFREPTPIQSEAIPVIMGGRDIIGCARTGTGKTAAFTLPLIQRLLNTWTVVRELRTRALILSPTRELAIQLHENIRIFGRYTDLTSLPVHGGTGYEKQIAALNDGVDILVATPGRLLDLLDRKALKLDQVEMFIVDEADRMLDMGFAPDIRRIAPLLPTSRQALFFSATMPREILQLAGGILQKPMHITSDPISAAAENIHKTLYYVEKNKKFALLERLLKRIGDERVLVFCRTRRGADRLAEHLQRASEPVAVLHGHKNQQFRQDTLEAFRRGETPVLIATDVAARGIDIENISHVINFDLPAEPETFVHRIGRTARAGASGTALSFCDATEKNYLRGILAHLGEEMEVDEEHPFHSEQIRHYTGSAKPKHTPGRQKPRSSIREQTTWRLTSNARARLHKETSASKKNSRRNPKKKKR